MYVSEQRFKILQDRFDELEKEVMRQRSAAYLDIEHKQEVFFPEHGWLHQNKQMPVSQALSLLMHKLKYEPKYTPEVSATYSLEPKK